MRRLILNVWENEIMKKRFVTPLLAATLVLGLGLTALADTIRLRDGSVIRGEIVGFKDQQFTVLIGAGARGRRSRITLYMEDVESIEFDGATGGDRAGSANDVTDMNDNTAASGRDTSPAVRPTPADSRTSTGSIPNRTSTPAGSSGSTAGPAFFPVRVRVRADNTANGWNDSGLMVRKGQRLRISATGRVSLGGGIYATPTGIRQPDADKLMRNEATGALIAVIGDDNDDFIYVGDRTEIIAKRDGRLFLGVNEGNLSDNSGAFDVTVEAEAVAGN